MGHGAPQNSAPGPKNHRVGTANIYDRMFIVVARYTNRANRDFDYLSDIIKITYNNNKTQTMTVVYIYPYNTITYNHQGN